MDLHNTINFPFELHLTANPDQENWNEYHVYFGEHYLSLTYFTAKKEYSTPDLDYPLEICLEQ